MGGEAFAVVLMQVVAWAAMAVIVGLVFFFRVRAIEQRRKMFEAALAANQPELARELLQRRWGSALARGLVGVGVGVALLIVRMWMPMGEARQVPLIVGACLLGAGIPLTIYGWLQEQKEREGEGGPGRAA